MYTQRKKLSAPRYIKTRIGYSTIETKEAARIGYSRFLLQHEYSGEGRGTSHQGRHPSTNAEKETCYIQYGQILLFQ